MEVINMEYRGIMFDKHGNGYTVFIWGDEVYCENLDEVYRAIDEYLDGVWR